jgi:hypothetical protein
MPDFTIPSSLGIESMWLLLIVKMSLLREQALNPITDVLVRRGEDTEKK